MCLFYICIGHLGLNVKATVMKYSEFALKKHCHPARESQDLIDPAIDSATNALHHRDLYFY